MHERHIGELRWQGHRLAYETRGGGDRAVVLLHGLLLPRHINGPLATRLAEQGHRVVLLDLLGHGRSDKPKHATWYRMDKAADQVRALLDHLGLDQAVVGGVSLGANVALEMTAATPERVRAAICEMPVLERGTIGVMFQSAPFLLAFRYLGRPIRWLFRAIEALPRPRHEVLRALLDTPDDPHAMAAVLHGFATGATCPPVEIRRRITTPTLVIGHTGDWMHPMDDAEALAADLPGAELVEADSFFELRAHPERITEQIVEFLDRVWAGEQDAVAG